MQRVAHRKSDEIHQLQTELKTWIEQAASLEMRLAGAEAKIKTLEEALKPFADAVYNDNGDMTVQPCGYDEHIGAYFAMKRLKL